MKIYKYSLTFIFLIFIFTNNVCSQNINNDNNNNNNIQYKDNNIINIYINSNNQNSGNGTIINPYNTTSIIIVNIGYGIYNDTNCYQFLILNCKNVTFKPYISNSSSSNDDNNNNNNKNKKEEGQQKVSIYNSFKIINSKFYIQGPFIRFYGSWNISNSEMNIIDNAYIIFKGKNNLYSIISNSVIKLINSTMISSIYNQKYMIEDSLLYFQRSTLKQVSINFNSKFSSSGGVGGGGSVEIIDSKVMGSFFQMGFSDINVKNSIWQETVLFTVADNSKFENIFFNQNDLKLWSEYYNGVGIINIDKDLYNENGSKITILNSEFRANPKYGALSLIVSLDIEHDVLIILYNIRMIGFHKYESMFASTSYGGNITISLELVEFDNCVSPSMFTMENTNLVISDLIFTNCIFETMLEARNSSNIEISNLSINSTQNNMIQKFLSMPKDENSFEMSSSIEFSNIFLESIEGSFEFRNSIVNFEFVTMISIGSDSFINGYQGSIINIISSDFISNPFGKINQLFYIEQSSITISQSNFFDSAVPIVMAVKNSSVLIENNSSFYDLQTSQPIITVADDSILEIYSSLFNNCRISSSSLIQSENSLVYISETNFLLVSQQLFNSSRSKISMNIVNISQSFTQSQLITSVDDYIFIASSVFDGNHGLIYQMFTLNGSILNITQTQFNGNSFNPMIKSVNSTMEFVENVYSNNSGSFINSKDDQLISISFLEFSDSRLPINYLLSSDSTKTIILNQIFINNNYFTQFFISSFNAETFEIDTFEFNNNLIVHVPMLLCPYNQFDELGGFISLTQVSNVLIKNFNIRNNQIGTTFLTFYDCAFSKYNSTNSNSNSYSNSYSNTGGSIGISSSGGGGSSDSCSGSSSSSSGSSCSGSVNIQNSLFLYNTIQSDISLYSESNYLIESKSSKVSISSTYFNKNQGNGKGLILVINSNITIYGCSIDSNVFQNGTGAILSFFPDYLIDDSFQWFVIVQSLLTSNTGVYGGVLYFNSPQSLNNPFSKIENNSFINNLALQQGGVIYTTDSLFNENMTKVLDSNTFISNSAFCGPNFSSNMMKNPQFSNPISQVVDDGSSIIEYQFVDYYGNLFTPFSSILTIYVNRTSTNHLINVTSNVNAGMGKFTFEYIGSINDEYLIGVNSPTPVLARVYVDGCSPYQFYNSTSEMCTYCPNNYALSQLLGKCYPCNTNIMNCLVSTVFAIDGYYLVNNDVSMVEQCPLDMCLSYNLCTSNSSFGNLCFSCKDEYGNLVQTKNGIRCCSHFKPILLVPILAFHLLFGLVLSLIKYDSFRIPISQIIIFLQINSVVFFSYSGIYILPLFRMSVDMLDGYCLWEGLNYNFKSFLSFSIIISLFLIGSTDITPSIIIKIYKKISTRKDNRNLSLLINDRNITPQQQPPIQQQPIAKYPNYIIKILEGKIKHRSIYYWKSIWSLFQLFVIPLAFNAMSLVISKQVGSENYLAVDFSIDFQSNSNQACILIAILIFIILAIVLFMQLILLLTKFKIGGNRIFKNKNTEFLLKIQRYQLEYRTNFKWFPIVIISRSIIICALSIVLLYRAQYYTPIILSFQIFYTIISLLINPIKGKYLRDFNNIINLLQVVILITANSNLIQSKSLFNEGLIITIITFSFALLSIISIFLLYNGKNKKIRRKLK
ncbi:hypothetical protein ACTFIW_011417 [Dictyostelium discoideum]